MHQIPKLKKLKKKELRSFGLLIGSTVVILFGLLLPWIRGHTLPLWPWIISAMFWACAFLSPTILNPIYQVWMHIGSAIGWIETRIILGIVFYLLVTPMGLAMRFLNRELVAIKLDRNLKTYRVHSKKRPRKSMEKPF